MPEATPSTVKISDGYAAASAVSNHIDTRTAAIEVSQQIDESLGGRADLLFLFASYHHRAAMKIAGDTLRTALGPRVMLGVTAESVLGGSVELEGRAGMSAIAFRLPGVVMHPYRMHPGDPPVDTRDKQAMRNLIGYREDTRTTIILAEPFSTPVAGFLPRMARCPETGLLPIGGGLASGASQPGMNVLLLNDQAVDQGVVGVTLSGPIDIEYVVSQGCKPIGTPLVVTKAEQNVAFELGGRPAMQVVQEMAESLPDREKQLLKKGLFIGFAIDEYKDRRGRGDFIIRNVIGYDQNKQAVAMGEVLKVGRTIQFHLRDEKTANEDLHLLLDGQQLKDPPFGVLCFTCNGRGSRLFSTPNHDVTVLRDRLGSPPVAGFFAAGEIGPIAGRSFLHGHTVSAAVFRRPT